jgi:3'(2'), 5'-bisphosphate nucleotidase
MFKSPINRPIIDIKKILAIAKAAGKIHMHYYNKDNIAVSYKDDDSPVTIADTDSNILICRELNKTYPNIPIISEENENDNINHDIFWCVDPLDGTRGFLKRNGEFTVNIALIYKKKPILGVIYASLSQDIYYVGNDNIPYKQPFGRIKSRKVPKEGLTVLTSSFFASDNKIQKHLKDKKVDKLIKASSSLKLCLIAEGKADLYPRFGRTMEWDTAAGHAILSAAGGSIKDFEGNDLSYGNLDKKYYNPSFIAQGLITEKEI